MPKKQQLLVGTHCGAIGRRILVATCPIATGGCMWQHRATKTCRFTADELTPSDFCERVGLPPPKESEVEQLRLQILMAVKGS